MFFRCLPCGILLACFLPYMANAETIYRPQHQDIPTDAEAPLISNPLAVSAMSNNALSDWNLQDLLLKPSSVHKHPVKRDMTKKGGSCLSICRYCRSVASRRVAALCHVECEWEGDAFKICMTLWAITQTSGRLDFRWTTVIQTLPAHFHAIICLVIYRMFQSWRTLHAWQDGASRWSYLLEDSALWYLLIMWGCVQYRADFC